MLKITSGLFRGRMIQAPTGEKTRPTQARLRQALFNSIQTSIPGARVLDLFAGSGALGFEALSRGAQHVSFVESNRAAVRVISANAKELGVQGQIVLHSCRVEELRLGDQGGDSYDIILADPPYELGYEMKLLETFPWETALVPEGLFCIEWGVQKSQVDTLPETFSCMTKVREKNYGDSVLTTYMRVLPNDSTSY